MARRSSSGARSTIANRRLPPDSDFSVHQDVVDLEDSRPGFSWPLDRPESRPVRRTVFQPWRKAPVSRYQRGYTARELLFSRPNWKPRKEERSLNVVGRAIWCVRRQQRREVLHALRVAGRRGVGRRGVRRTSASRYSCA